MSDKKVTTFPLTMVMARDQHWQDYSETSNKTTHTQPGRHSDDIAIKNHIIRSTSSHEVSRKWLQAGSFVECVIFIERWESEHYAITPTCCHPSWTLHSLLRAWLISNFYINESRSVYVCEKPQNGTNRVENWSQLRKIRSDLIGWSLISVSIRETRY